MSMRRRWCSISHGLKWRAGVSRTPCICDNKSILSKFVSERVRARIAAEYIYIGKKDQQSQMLVDVCVYACVCCQLHVCVAVFVQICWCDCVRVRAYVKAPRRVCVSTHTHVCVCGSILIRRLELCVCKCVIKCAVLGRSVLAVAI